MPKDTTQTARLYRMVMPDHLCPYGLKSKDLLERKDFEVEDHHLTTREETDAFMEEHGVETTPQTWIGNERIGAFHRNCNPGRTHIGRFNGYRRCLRGDPAPVDQRLDHAITNFEHQGRQTAWQDQQHRQHAYPR